MLSEYHWVPPLVVALRGRLGVGNALFQHMYLEYPWTYTFFKRTSNSDNFPSEMKTLCWPCRLYQLKMSCSFIIRDLSAVRKVLVLNLIGLTWHRIQFINEALSTQSGARFLNFWFRRKFHHFLWKFCKFFTKNDIIFFKIKNSKIQVLIA